MSNLMSNIAIKGATTGTGVFTLASPATNTDRVLTLPDEAGTVDLLQRSGNVLQVLESVNTTQQSTNSTSNIATGITASITPSSSSSKIFVFCNYTGYVSPASITAYYSIYRGATNITSPQGTRLESAGGSWFGSQVFSILDSPATTSSTSYTLYFSVQSGATAIVNLSSSPGRMILMEIAA